MTPLPQIQLNASISFQITREVHNALMPNIMKRYDRQQMPKRRLGSD